jgi:hypothetical protein
MTVNHRLSSGDVRRLLSELRAQLPPGYRPFDDFWCAPYDCDGNTGFLDRGTTPESLGQVPGSGVTGL